MKASLNTVMIKAIELEKAVSECYRTLKQIAPLQSLKDQLEELSKDEENHVILLRTGQNYVMNAPDAFGETQIGLTEIEAGLRQAVDLIDLIRNRRIGLHAALQKICDLEHEFETIHLNRVAEISDEELKNLFSALSRDDRDHAERLDTLIKDWEIKS